VPREILDDNDSPIKADGGMQKLDTNLGARQQSRSAFGKAPNIQVENEEVYRVD